MTLVKAFRQLVSVIIVLQLIAPRVYAEQVDDNYTDTLAESMARSISDPRERTQLDQIQRFSDTLEKGDLKNANPEDFDTFSIANQRVEILRDGKVIQTISLSDYRIELPSIVYTDVRTVYDRANKQIVFEGVRGMLADGTGGEVVARHIVPNMDLLTIARDKEIVMLVDRTGKLHAIDKGYVTEQIFKNPIPIVKNVWEPTYDVGNLAEAEAKYITRGVRPYNEAEVDANTVIPTDIENKPVFKAGDLLVRTKDVQGNIRVLGVFSREVTYQRLRTAAMYLISEAALIAPNEETVRFAEDVLGLMNEEVKPEELHDSMDNLTKRFLQKLDVNQLQSLKNRFEKNTEFNERRRDVIFYNEWLQSFDDVLNNKVKFYKDKEEELQAKIAKFERLHFPSKYVQTYRDELDQTQKQLRDPEVGLKQSWSKFVDPLPRSSPFEKNDFGTLSKMVDKVFSMRTLARMLTVGGIGYVALPFAYDKIEVLHQVMTLNWMYEHYAFAVLKDQEYRFALMLSMTSMLSLWPLAHAASWASQNILFWLQKSVGRSGSKAANYIRDLAHQWTPLGNWQRLTSFGMRIYAVTMYPVLRFAATYVFNQRSLFISLQNGINPLQKISPDSELGRSVGLKDAQWLGFNNPFLVGQKLESATEVKQKLMSHIAEKNEAARHLAWILAIQMVSVKEGIDPATLVEVSGGKVNPDNLMELIQNKDLKRDWYLISNEIYQQLKAYEITGADVESVDPKLVSEFFQIAKDAAAKINSYPNSKKAAAELAIKFRRMPTWVFNNAPLVAGGMKEFQFLKSIHTSKFVSDQVYKEFVLDHISMAGIYSLMGARADLSSPQNLAADPNGFLWTSKGNLYDMFFNTYIHFFMTGARTALVYQTVHPSEAEEYFPIEDYSYKSSEREQPLMKGSYEWLRDVANTSKSDMGSYVVKNFSKRFMTVQSGFAMTAFFQSLLLHRSLSQSLLAFSISFFAGQWFYGWVWDPVQRGNQMEGERFKVMQEALNNARYAISIGLREADPEKSQALIKDGYKKLFELYRKYNPEALNKLSDMLKGNFLTQEDKDLKETIANLQASLKKEVPHEEAVYFGLMSELAMAIESKNQERVKSAYKSLSDYYVQKQNGTVSATDLEKLSARGLLEFTKAVPPIYTSPNSVITWLTTFGAAAGSTILATPYSVRITDNSYITVENLVYWMAWSAVLYPTIYFLLNKKTGAKIYEYAVRAKEKFFPRDEQNDKKTDPKATDALVVCQFLFAK